MRNKKNKIFFVHIIMVNIKCIVTNLTFGVTGLSILCLKYGKRYMKLGSAILLMIVSLLGNILCIKNKDELIKYCEIERLNPGIIDIANIITHLIVPFLIISVLLKNVGVYKLTRTLYLETTGFVMFIGLSYLAAMNSGLVSNYGLNRDALINFSISYVILTIILPILLEWK